MRAAVSGTHCQLSDQADTMVVAGAIAMKMGDALAAVPNAHTVAEGDEPMGNTPAQFAAYVKREIARWSTVVQAMGMRAG